MPSVEVCSPLIEAAKLGRDEKVKEIFTAGYHGNEIDDGGKTALHWAAECGYLEVVCTLIAFQQNVNCVDHKQQTPLLLACLHKRQDVAKVLIESGCDVNIGGCNGMTPLHRAVHANMESVVDLLCEVGADVNARNTYLCTPLHEAMRTANENVVRKLLQYGADVNATSKNKMSPFLTAVFYFKIAQRNTYICLEPILELLIKNHAQLGQSDGQWTPLSATVNLENSYIAMLLILHGCKIVAPGKYSRSLLVEMFTRCDPHLVKLFVAAGYQVTQDEVEQCSKRVPTFSRSFLRLTFPGIDHGKGQLETLQWLKERVARPFSLCELSRTAIRNALNEAGGDTTILTRITQLPLPVSIQQFIALRGSVPQTESVFVKSLDQ